LRTMSKDHTTSHAEHERLLVENERLRRDLAAADLRGRIDRLERLTEDLEQFIYQLQKFTGAPKFEAWGPLEAWWRPLAEAAKTLGCSERDLLKHIEGRDEGGVIWFQRRDGQIFVDVDAAPVPRLRVVPT
jgi:hypothetical protein